MPDGRDGFLEGRRSAIVEAAERVFVRRGFDAATMQEIADEAGSSAGNIYRYFEGKEDLIRTAIEGCEGRHAGLFQVTAAGTTSPTEVLIAAGQRIWLALPAESARDEAVLNLESTLVATRVPAVAAPLAQAMRSTRMLLVRLIAHAKSAERSTRRSTPPRSRPCCSRRPAGCKR